MRSTMGTTARRQPDALSLSCLLAARAAQFSIPPCHHHPPALTSIRHCRPTERAALIR